MRVIELTKGRVAIVDDEDFEKLAQWRWCFHETNGAQRSVKFKNPDGTRSGKTIRMQNQIMPPPTGMIVDHKNGNQLDNRRCNLRFATLAQNAQNRRVKKDSQVGLKGVRAKKRSNGSTAYIAAITVSGKYISLGTHNTAEEAHSAYCAAATKHYGEFVRFN